MSPRQACTPAGRAGDGSRTFAAHYLNHVAPHCAPAQRCAESSEVLAHYRRFLTRPAFLTRDQQAGLSRDLLRLLELVFSLPARGYGGDVRAFARQVGWTTVQIESVLDETVEAPEPLGRVDLLRGPSGFRVLEINMGAALGGLSCAELNRAVLRDTAMAELAGQTPLGFTDPLRPYVDTLRARHPRIAALERPIVALTEWPGSFSETERHLHYLRRLLGPLGVEAIPCHAGQLEVLEDGVFLGGRRVDVVQRRFIVENLLEGPEAVRLVQPLVAAARRGAVVLFSTMETELYGSKGCLALLSEWADRALFTAEERDLIDRLVPWTRLLQDAGTTIAGRKIDLVPHVLAHRNELLIKPVALHGGQGVVAGWRCSASQWADAVAEALHGSFVVQERVHALPELFPATGRAANGATAAAADAEPTVLNWGVFITARGFSGAIIRGVADPEAGVISLGNGARFGCCFTVGESTDQSEEAAPLPA